MLAMLFLVIFTSLAVGMYELSTLNTQSAANLTDLQRARATAESGMRWITYRLAHMTRPRTPIGNITSSVATNLWTPITTAIKNDLAQQLTVSERTVTVSGNTLMTAAVADDETSGRFVITMRQHPVFAGDPMDARYVRITSTGTSGKAVRSISMDFRIDKKVKFAVVGKVEIQIGKNTLVEGNVAMGTPAKYPPFVSLSDFKHLTTALDTNINNFETFLKANHTGYDGRVSVNNPKEYQAAVKAGYSDVNGDGFIDEYDLFVKEFDKNGDRKISSSEFTNPTTGQLYDQNLFTAIDSLGGQLQPTDAIRAGYQDGTLSNNDAYAKIRGQVLLADSQASWASNLAGQGLTLNDMFAGPIIPPSPSAPPVQFGVDPNQLFDLSPSNFDTSTFANASGPAAGATSRSATVIQNAVLSAAWANGGTLTEHTPSGSTSWQATYTRPVFKNITFVNCTVPKGLNALFQNCTFQGTTFVQMTTNITDSSGNTTTSAGAGMTWSQRMRSGSFSNNTALTASNSYGFTDGNNLHFDNCTINGPLASDVPTAYTHFSNSWEFTGSSYFDNQANPTASIIAPQVNIEMGSYTDPSKAPSTMLGVVVVGNMDIRGTTLIDGSLIVTGDGAGNTTLGYFGASDASSDPNSVPSTGWGKINLRYNPYRPLPDGINIPVDILPNPDTYTEGS
jgi:Tfp pilus assembly protein PilX